MALESQITTSKATSILNEIFGTGRIIHLSTTQPTATGGNFTKPTGSDYAGYTIKSGDFTIANGVVKSAKHLLFGLATTDWGTITHFGVFNNATCEYFGKLTEAKPVTANTVPVFKIFDDTKGEGIKVSLDVE